MNPYVQQIGQLASLLDEASGCLLAADELAEKQAHQIEALQKELQQRKQAHTTNCAKAASLAKGLVKAGLCSECDMEKVAQSLSTDPIGTLTPMFDFYARHEDGKGIQSELVDKLQNKPFC